MARRIELIDDRFTLIPVNEITIPKDNYRVIIDCYWEVYNDCVLGFKINLESRHPGTPQCNKNEGLMQHLKYQTSEIVFIKTAYWKPYNSSIEY